MLLKVWGESFWTVMRGAGLQPHTAVASPRARRLGIAVMAEGQGKQSGDPGAMGRRCSGDVRVSRFGGGCFRSEGPQYPADGTVKGEVGEEPQEGVQPTEHQCEQFGGPGLFGGSVGGGCCAEGQGPPDGQGDEGDGPPWHPLRSDPSQREQDGGQQEESHSASEERPACRHKYFVTQGSWFDNAFKWVFRRGLSRG